ncbi:hypothetical protein K438DRAFT_1755081 [Mycena galopus ATCC 62051]|nr:hypothetical protein K438DRAFT_1755081 [Mycena galopus ATCC 62051]
MGGERELDGKQGILLILGSVLRVWNALSCSRRTEEPAVELREPVALRSVCQKLPLWLIAHGEGTNDTQQGRWRGRGRDWCCSGMKSIQKGTLTPGSFEQAEATKGAEPGPRTGLDTDAIMGDSAPSERTQRAGAYTDGAKNVGGGRASMAHIEGGVIEPEKARGRQEARKKSGGDTGIEAPHRCQRSLEAKFQSIRQPPTGFMQELLPGGISLAKARNQQSARSEGEQVEGGGRWSDGDGVNLTCVNKSTHLVERPRAINSGGQAGQRWARKSSQRSGRAKSRSEVLIYHLPPLIRGPVIYQIPGIPYIEVHKRARHFG